MKSTHRGQCQACGRMQMLPRNVLAKHGYTVTFGFFSGTCKGAGYLPFEKSFDQVERYIAAAETELKRLERYYVSLIEPTDETTAWHHEYVRVNGRCRYEWRKLQVGIQPTGPWAPDSMTVTVTLSPDNANYRGLSADAGRTAPIHTLGIGNWQTRTIAEVVGWMNTRRAEDLLRLEITPLRRYIEWQRKRVAEWTEQPLTPVDGKFDDANAFNPAA